MKNISKSVCILTVSSALLGVTGCAALNTAIQHRHLDVETKMSRTIFLKPVSNHLKTVYFDLHNASGHRLPNVKPVVQVALQEKGYRVVRSISSAHYILQANVLQIGKLSRSAARNALGHGYGSGLAGAAVGAAMGGVVGGTATAAVGGGLIGGLIGTVTNDFVTDTTYTIITDVQVSERFTKGVSAHSSTFSFLEQGNSTREVEHLSQRSRWLKYRTRIVSIADKVNLKFAQAKHSLEQQLADSIASIL